MDTGQLLLTISIIITTIFIVIVGIQLVFLIKDIRKSLNHPAEEHKKKSLPHRIVKKPVSLLPILDKVRFLSPNKESSRKKFFVKDKSS